MSTPDFITHYHLGDRRPFLNLSDLGGAELEAVRAELQALRKSHGHVRPFGRQYMEFRRLTEARMRELFVAGGGVPERRVPHYFVLGRSRWFEEHAPDTREVRLPLASLPPEATSFTYPDSFEAMGFGDRFGIPRGPRPRPYHDRVFRLWELEEVVRDHGLPDVEFDEFWSKPVEKYIEFQLWVDGPVSRYLA